MDEFNEDWKALEALRGKAKSAPAPGFGPYFSARVMRALNQADGTGALGESLYPGLRIAFARVGIAGVALGVLLSAWLAVLSKSGRDVSEAEPSLEQELETAQYQHLEELI